MNRKMAWMCVGFGLAGCLGSAATNIGDTETIPLVRVDGSSPPVTITDANGANAQIVSGSLTTYSTRSECDYEILLSTGKKIPGTMSCLSGSVGVISGGVQLKLNLASAGAPQGEHSYDFVGSQKPCECPKWCLCRANKLPSETRSSSVGMGDSQLESYQSRLSAALVPVVQKR